MKKSWQDLAASEMRIKLMREVGKFGVGIGKIENFEIEEEEEMEPPFLEYQCEYVCL